MEDEMQRATVNRLANFEMCLPDSLVVPLFPAASRSQQPFTSTLESNSESGLVFDHPVLYLARMVWGSTGFRNTVQRTKLLDQRTLEAPSLVRMKTAWDAKLIITFVDQNLGHSGGPLIRSRKIYSEFAEHVSHDKDVLKPVPGGVQQGGPLTQKLHIWTAKLPPLSRGRLGLTSPKHQHLFKEGIIFLPGTKI
ncbi:hypothetical protein NQZ68_012417 [Dissostichus eleginoides]|nr:hypothetical protein NQZ68_012417 [Dissostichus eleginoides]